MKQIFHPSLIIVLLLGLGCEQPDRRNGESTADQNSGLVPVSEMWGEPENTADDGAKPAERDAARTRDSVEPRPGTSRTDETVERDRDEHRDPPTWTDTSPPAPAGDETDSELDQPAPASPPSEPRSIRVATWHPPDVETPEWIYPAVRAVRGGRRMFGHYNGDYERYTAAVIREIKRLNLENRPVTLILQHWINRAHVRGNRPEGIDRFGLFTHIDDRTEEGFPGIWPDAGMEFWHQANDHLLRELKKAGIELDFFALDTEVSPHGAAGLYSFEGTHHSIVNDPRWHEKPLLGFDGLTAADIWPNPPLDDYRQLWEFNRMIGQHAFATAVNKVLTSRVLEHYPDALVSDYRWGDRWRAPETETRAERSTAVRKIIEATNADGRWLQRGVGNAGSPAFYGHRVYQGRTDDHGRPVSTLTVMLERAGELIEQYGDPKYVAPWITTRARMDENIRGERITEEAYRQWIKALVDLGIERFLWWPSGEGDPVGEQRLTVSAFEEAVAASE